MAQRFFPLTLLLTLLLTLGACNPVPPLSDADKAKFVIELIEADRACDPLRSRLAVPGIASPAIDAIYQDAKKTGCIKRDV